MENIQREMRNIEGNFMSLLFDRNNLVEFNEWLHEAYLNNNEDIHNLKTQNEQLPKRLQHYLFFLLCFRLSYGRLLGGFS